MTEFLNIVRADWMERANCLGVDAELFFPMTGEPASAAKAICAGCRVRTECLDYAVDNHILEGIWGGLSPKQRRVSQIVTRSRAGGASMNREARGGTPSPRASRQPHPWAAPPPWGAS